MLEFNADAVFFFGYPRDVPHAPLDDDISIHEYKVDIVSDWNRFLAHETDAVPADIGRLRRRSIRKIDLETMCNPLPVY